MGPSSSVEVHPLQVLERAVPTLEIPHLWGHPSPRTKDVCVASSCTAEGPCGSPGTKVLLQDDPDGCSCSRPSCSFLSGEEGVRLHGLHLVGYTAKSESEAQLRTGQGGKDSDFCSKDLGSVWKAPAWEMACAHKMVARQCLEQHPGVGGLQRQHIPLARHGCLEPR
ncbi:hypothetical protein TREES_T100012101 [Tupaia chinensis]|uniref:Uncharacterized protein n=1 Tax=Tupaia chinensis TaxID=246437 RepID=L9K3N5_TUPCH|nr:hypothetical protein TREES_T100012101 [Tupaia chinensis]